MQQQVTARNEQVQALKDVSETVAPAPLTRAFAAGAAEEFSAQRYAARALRATNPNALTTENTVEAGAEMLSRLLGLTDRTKAPSLEAPAARVPNAARVAFDIAETDLEGVVNAGERFKVAARASEIAASRERLGPKNDPVAQQAAERAAKDNQWNGLLVRSETTYLPQHIRNLNELQAPRLEAEVDQKPAAEAKAETKVEQQQRAQTFEEMMDLSSNTIGRNSLNSALQGSVVSTVSASTKFNEMSGPREFSRAAALEDLALSA